MRTWLFYWIDSNHRIDGEPLKIPMNNTNYFLGNHRIGVLLMAHLANLANRKNPDCDSLGPSVGTITKILLEKSGAPVS